MKRLRRRAASAPTLRGGHMGLQGDQKALRVHARQLAQRTVSSSALDAGLRPFPVFSEGMAANLIDRLRKSPVLCDGAMGTLLYSKGVFINRSYDELNLSQPDLIRGIHHEYLQAGAEIIETNTFGANAFRLARHSIADKVRDINRAGARLAREAAKSFDVWVAGSVGPLGTRIEPLGKTSFEEARQAFREQIEVLAEGGVDLLMLETFGYLEELHQAVLAAKDVGAKLPLVVQVTIDEDGNCLDGSDPETFVPRLEEWGADVIG